MDFARLASADREPSTSGPATYITQGGIASHGATDLLGHMLARAGPTGFGSGSTAEQVAEGWQGEGKVVIITGASTGLGLESARVLAACGAHVIWGVRDMAKAERAAAVLRDAMRNVQLTLLPLDLASLPSVRHFAAAFQALRKPLHALILNAGIARPPFQLSPGGHELQFATNHLGHFLLTQLLLEDLVRTAEQQGAEGRVVVLSSAAHHFQMRGDLGLDRLGDGAGYSPWGAYGRSKLCNILFTRALQERLQARNARVTAVCCHPGNIKTEIVRYWPANVFSTLILALAAPTMKTVAQGAATQVYLATAPSVVGGEYYADVNVCQSSRLAHDRLLAEQLWAVSEQLCREQQ